MKKVILISLLISSTSIANKVEKVIEMAETLCNRIGVIDQGKLMALGTVNEIQTSTGVRNLEDAFIRLIGG